jgi:hypothetical protein
MFIPRYEVTSSRREVTQKVELEVELDMVGSISMVEFMVDVEFMSVESRVHGRVGDEWLSADLISYMARLQPERDLRLETDELSNKRVHADNVLNIGTRNIILGEV